MSESKAANARWLVALVVVIALAAVAMFVFRRPQADANAEAAPAAANTGRVAFMMEQQWLIKLKLAKAEEAELAPQIRSTGRVVPVPANQALVAPPVSGIIQSGTLPRIGQQVNEGQRLATLIQTPTAAEAAQLQIESAQIVAERRRLTQQEDKAEARLEKATHNL